MKKLSLKILGMIIIGIVVLQGTVFATSNINQLNNKKEQNQDYIIKEAEMIINNYCNKIENNQKKEKILKSIQKKNKRMKKYLLILMIISIIEMIIIVLK